MFFFTFYFFAHPRDENFCEHASFIRYDALLLIGFQSQPNVALLRALPSPLRMHYPFISLSPCCSAAGRVFTVFNLLCSLSPQHSKSTLNLSCNSASHNFTRLQVDELLFGEFYASSMACGVDFFLFCSCAIRQKSNIATVEQWEERFAMMWERGEREERKYLHDCISIHHEIDPEWKIIYFSSHLSLALATVTTSMSTFNNTRRAKKEKKLLGERRWCDVMRRLRICIQS